jgi:Arc/MetJ-type ribon-helix-helix transcriptional regulator
MRSSPKTLRVRFTKQQLVFLEMLREEGRFGSRLEDVMLETFREYVRATLPKKRA